MKKIEKVKKAMLAMQRYSWEQGVAAQSLLEAGETEWTILLAREAVHRGAEDGRVAWMGNFPGITDPCSNGEAIGLAFKETKDPIFEDAYRSLLDWALFKAPRNGEGIIYHQESAPEFWVDSFYMMPPFLAYAGCFDECMKQINGWWEKLFDKNAELLSHIWHDGKQSFTRKDFWGVGNGWAMAGMARLVTLLPESMKLEKSIIVDRIKVLLAAGMKYQRSDALFHDVLDDPNTFVEINFAQMVAYTIYRGISEGWLSEFENGVNLPEKAHAIRKAAHSKVDSYGYVGGVCGAPSFSASGYAVEGQAFFILMESAAAKLGVPEVS